MGSIPKIVSTPLKWVSKKILNHTLLRFPGGDAHQPVVCIYCPEMCRFSCPTAVVSGNDVVTPCNKMGLLYKENEWPGVVSQGKPLWPIYDCTGCGRCTEFCVYEMPVPQKLFEARKKYKWDRAVQAAASLTDQQDLVGDLADELGDEENAERRLKQFLGLHPQETRKVEEPKSLSFLEQGGHSGVLPWEKVLQQGLTNQARKRLQGKRWLVHESVWYSRRLGNAAGNAKAVQDWVKALNQDGVEILQPFANGKDCIDCGGEGAYSSLFPSQAAQMARDIWERDQHRADGIVCISRRCAEHFKKELGNSIPVIALAELD